MFLSTDELNLVTIVFVTSAKRDTACDAVVLRSFRWEDIKLTREICEIIPPPCEIFQTGRFWENV